jgi:negative regulator of sigma E activity
MIATWTGVIDFDTDTTWNTHTRNAEKRRDAHKLLWKYQDLKSWKARVASAAIMARVLVCVMAHVPHRAGAKGTSPSEQEIKMAKFTNCSNAFGLLSFNLKDNFF